MTSPHGIAEILAFYGDVKIGPDPQGGWRIVSPIGWESAHCTTMILPDGRHLYVNKAIVEPLKAALAAAPGDYLIKTIGCFAPRPKRTAKKPPPGTLVGLGEGLSMHSFAAAVDINALTNPMQKPLKTDMPDAFVKAFTDNGWTWGGTFPTPDPMHFQWGSGY